MLLHSVSDLVWLDCIVQKSAFNNVNAFRYWLSRKGIALICFYTYDCTVNTTDCVGVHWGFWVFMLRPQCSHLGFPSWDIMSVTRYTLKVLKHENELSVQVISLYSEPWSIVAKTKHSIIKGIPSWSYKLRILTETISGLIDSKLICNYFDNKLIVMVIFHYFLTLF